MKNRKALGTLLLILALAGVATAGVAPRHAAEVEGVTPGNPILGVDGDGPWCSLELLSARQPVRVVARAPAHYASCSGVAGPMLVRASVELKPAKSSPGSAPVAELRTVKLTITID